MLAANYTGEHAHAWCRRTDRLADSNGGSGFVGLCLRLPLLAKPRIKLSSSTYSTQQEGFFDMRQFPFGLSKWIFVDCSVVLSCLQHLGCDTFGTWWVGSSQSAVEVVHSTPAWPHDRLADVLSGVRGTGIGGLLSLKPRVLYDIRVFMGRLGLSASTWRGGGRLQCVWDS